MGCQNVFGRSRLCPALPPSLATSFFCSFHGSTFQKWTASSCPRAGGQTIFVRPYLDNACSGIAAFISLPNKLQLLRSPSSPLPPGLPLHVRPLLPTSPLTATAVHCPQYRTTSSQRLLLIIQDGLLSSRPALAKSELEFLAQSSQY